MLSSGSLYNNLGTSGYRYFWWARSYFWIGIFVLVSYVSDVTKCMKFMFGCHLRSKF